MKKLLYSTLVAAMVLGFGVGAFGAVGVIAPVPFTDIAGHAAEAELTLMASLGIFTGSGLGGTVNPNGSITRAEFCKVIVLATGKGSTAAGLAGLKPTFTDAVPAWAWGYVNTAFFMGVIAGYPDGSFKADNPVTYQEAITMLVKAIPQHKLQVPAGIWPYNYIFYAVDKNFTGAVDVGAATAPCTRGDMARMLFATMTNVVPIDADGAPSDHPILWELDRLHTGKFTGFNGEHLTVAGVATIDAAASVYLVGATSWSELLNQPVLAVENTSNDVVFVLKTEGTGLAGVLADVGHDATGDYLVLADDSKVYYSAGDLGTHVPVVLNDAAGHTNHDLAIGDELAFNLNDSGFAVQVFALRWDLVYEDTVSDTYRWDYIIDAHDATASPDLDANMVFSTDSHLYYWDIDTAAYATLTSVTLDIPDDAVVTINGAAASANDLKKYDVVKGATLGADGYHLGATTIIAVSADRNAFQGTVTGRNLTYPGPKEYVTFTVDGASKTYEIDRKAHYLEPTDLGVGNLYKMLLADGMLFQTISLGTASPVVYVKSVRIVTEGPTPHNHYYLDVDNHGTAVSYEWDFAHAGENPTPWQNHFAELTIDNATGLAIHGADFCVGTALTVVAAGATNATLGTGYPTPTTPYYFFDDVKVVVYSLTDTGYVFIGFAGLAAGEAVSTSTWVIVRDDR
jgi:hypothetical protein